MSETALELSTEFLAIAACPACHAKFAVDYERSELVCTSAACGLAYPVEDANPDMIYDQQQKQK